VAEHLTDAKFEIEEQPSGVTTMTCQGIGFQAPSQQSADSKVPADDQS
jgi:hypothetical protein